MLAHNLPRSATGELPPPQIVACSSHQFKEMTQANEANQELFIDRYFARKDAPRLLVDGCRVVPVQRPMDQYRQPGIPMPRAFPHGLRRSAIMLMPAG